MKFLNIPGIMQEATFFNCGSLVNARAPVLVAHYWEIRHGYDNGQKGNGMI